MTGELIVLLEGRPVGTLVHHPKGRLGFFYNAEWRGADHAYPVSLSLPLPANMHGSQALESFLWGLLPDSERILESWARKFQTSPRNLFSLISHVGEDCAGAVQFIRPERLHDVISGKADAVAWLSEAQVAGRLKALREDYAAWRLPRDTGQFSLAGAQPKTALIFDKEKWGIPSGRVPTTHILKPPTGAFDGHAENEHICLTVARACGLPVAVSHVQRFEKEVAIVLERYDRQMPGKKIMRIHQEDLCQALGILPSRKYQNEGGPSAANIVELLRTYSGEAGDDVWTFALAVGFNWIIAGTDAHAKNYSLLITHGNYVRLAPLYDIASVLPYPRIDTKRAKMSMKIGSKYLMTEIGLRDWQRFAAELRLNFSDYHAELTRMADRIPDEAAAARDAARGEGLRHKILDSLVDALAKRARACGRILRYAAGP